MTNERGVDVVFEAAGTVETIRESFEVVRSGGMVVLVGAPLEGSAEMLVMEVLAKEIDVRAVFRYANAYPRAIRLVSQGRIDVKCLITHRFPLARVKEALDLCHSRANGVIKALVDINTNPTSLTQVCWRWTVQRQVAYAQRSLKKTLGKFRSQVCDG